MRPGARSHARARTLARLGAFLAPALVLSCGFDLGFALRTAPPLPVTLTADEIVIPEGVAVGARLLEGGSPIDATTNVELTPAEPWLAIYPTGKHGEIVVHGLEPGQTVVHVTVDGEPAFDIPATVSAQP